MKMKNQIKINQKINYSRFSFLSNSYENRKAVVTFIKNHPNGMVEYFITDIGDQNRNCLVYLNGKSLSIGAKFA